MELLLYVGIASIILLISSFFLSTLMRSGIKDQTISEVDQQGLIALNMVTQSIRNAESLITPTQGQTSATLSLTTDEPGMNPTQVYLSDGALVMKEGQGDALPLTNQRVRVSDLTFSNLGNEGTPGAVHVSYVLTAANPGGSEEYSFTRTFYASASLRRH